MDNKKVVERARMRIETDGKRFPDADRVDEIIEHLETKYGLEGKVSWSVSVERGVVDVKADSNTLGLPIMAAVETFIMNLGSVMIYKRLTEYDVF